MKRTGKDRRQDFFLAILRRLVNIWMFFDFKTTYILKDGLSFKRKEPYVMLANHTFLFDVIHVPLKFKVQPYIVASQTLMNRQPTKFLLTEIAHVVPKSKGSADLRTAKDLISSIKRGYPILIFPEGDTTFSGQTNYIEESTMKLIKKLKVDVIACHVSGGYLSRPRWATGKRKNRQAVLEYSIAIHKEELSEMTVEQINERMKEALYHNDYDYQREHMIPHPGKQLAEGFENVVYICSECQEVNSIVTSGNTIKCSNCNTEGTMNEYGFITGFTFDNIVEWDKYQRQFTSKLRQTVIETTATLYFANYNTSINELIGKVNIRFKDGIFHFTGSLEEDIPVNLIRTPVLTLRRNFSFTYQDRDFFMKLDGKAAAFIRVAQEKY